MIPLTPVKSSQIAAHGYDAVNRVLAIRFNSGGDKVYQYRDVPPEVAEGLAKAESVGKYFGAAIRGKFEHAVVLDDEAQAAQA